MKRFLQLSLLALVLGAGCVAVDDNHVQVVRPGQVDNYQRNVLDKCDPHVYPHRLIKALTGVGSALYQQGAVGVNDAPTFDKFWSSISPALDENKVPSFSMKPLINFDQETAYFLPVVINNSCQKVVPYGDEMSTDCYSITIPIYRYNETTNCQTVNDVPVFVYIFPKNTLPLGMQWIDPTATSTPTCTPTTPPTATPTVTATPEDE